MRENPEKSDTTRLEAELIERIYDVAIRPHTYDDFMQKWGDYVQQALEDLKALEHEVKTSDISRMDAVSRHFDMGFRLLEELGRSNPASNSGEAGAGGGASFLIDREGRIVWYNAPASRFFELRRISRIDDLSLWDRSRTELDRMVRALSAPDLDPADQTVLRLHSATADKTLFMLAQPLEDAGDDPLIRVSQIVSDWHESVGRVLADSFGLSEAEIQIASFLVEGAEVGEIAALRSSSVNTVRTQIKSLLARTGLSSRTELVRILVSLNGIADRASTAGGHVSHGRTLRFRQRHGRMVPYHRFGPDNGRPFILFHGMLDGCDLSGAAVDQLYARGLSILVPERPFFGSAAGAEGPINEAPERFARDVEDLLDHLGIASVGLVGHMAGSVYAFAAAAHLGERAHSVVSVSGGVPIVSSDQFAFMSPRQRLVAYTARYTPGLLPFVLRAGIRQLDFGGEKRFMQSLYANAPRDLEAIGDAETLRIIAAGYHFSIAQGHRAFEIDSHQVVNDWTWRVEQSQAPVLLLHGRDDPVVSAASVEDFARRLGQRARLVIDDDAGQLLLYLKPETVISALAELH